MKSSTKEQRTVKTTETVFAILEILKEQDGARITEVAEALELAKSTVHRHLTTLVQREYVVKEGDVYHVSLRFVELGEHARDRKKGYQLARTKVEELATETDERVQFIVEEHGWAVYTHRAIGSHGVQTDPGIGKRIPLHATSAGKSILAHLPDERVSSIIDQRGLPAFTDHTITDRDELFDDLESIHEQGYSVNNQENIDGLRAIGVPVLRPNNRVLGALSVSGPTRRMKDDWFEHELPDLLLGTANELELNIAYS